MIGGRGYVGSALVAAASASPDLDVLATSSSAAPGFVPFRLETGSDVSGLGIRDGDVVFLTAAISAPDVCSREHERAWSVNVTGSAALVDAVLARGGRVVFFSSDTVYGERADAFDETAACTPAGEYAEMKHELERRFLGAPGFKAIRLSYVFSRRDKFTSYLTACAEKGEEAELFHPFDRAVVHRADVVEGALALARRWDDVRLPVVNFGGPEVLSRVDFAERLKRTVLPGLTYRVTEPGEAFFRSRPRVIAMRSPILPELLGRPGRELGAAAELEFT